MEMYFKLVFVTYCYLCSHCVTGGRQNSYPYEFQNIPGDMRINTISVPNSNISPHTNHMSRQQIIHTGMQSHPAPTAEKQTKNSGYTFNDLLYAMNGLSDEQENLRASYRTLANQQNYSSPRGSTRQNYDSWSSQPFQDSIYTSSTIDPESTYKALPKFNLIEPVATKMSTKVSGLMQLVIALLGSGSNNLIMKGFKDVIIDGIVRPLLVAKGGIKMLISKLTIPFISLLLINLEVLVTVWWLWDDCSEHSQPTQPSYPTSPNSYNYNTYNTTFR